VGGVARDGAGGQRLDLEQRARAGRDVTDVLARIHAVDPDAVGLGDLGRKEGYIERQLRRWHGQYEKSKARDLPLMDEVHAALASRVPDQGPAAIVHGDYRLDNCLVGADGRIAAVLDWELCTLGDPLADLGLLLVYWTETGDEHPALPGAPTMLDGFPSRPEVVAAYAEASGRDVAGIDYYVAFGYWKLACIVEGVHARYRAGAMGSGNDPAAFELFASQVEMLARNARAAVERLG
jgi:aminoglycoside phosphotransferase (APT) family kinase protein